MDLLPEALLCEVCSHLPDLCMALHAFKLLRSAALNPELSAWRVLSFESVELYSTQPWIKEHSLTDGSLAFPAVSSRCVNIEAVNMVNIAMELPDSLEQLVLRNRYKLRALRLSPMSVPALRFLDLSNLRTLNLSHTDITGPDLLDLRPHSLPKLLGLSLSGCHGLLTKDMSGSERQARCLIAFLCSLIFCLSSVWGHLLCAVAPVLCELAIGSQSSAKSLHIDTAIRAIRAARTTCWSTAPHRAAHQRMQ